MLTLLHNIEPANELLSFTIEGNPAEYSEKCDPVMAYLVPRPLSQASEWSDVVKFFQGTLRWQDGNQEEALAIWRQESMIGVYWYNKGQLLLEQQSVELAITQLSLAWQVAPQHFRARIAFALAKSYAQLGQTQEALFFYEKAVAVSSSLPVEAEFAHRAKWHIAMLNQDYDHAHALALELTEQKPSDALSWISLAQASMGMGHPLQAIRPLERALQLTDGGAQVRYLLARAYREAGDYWNSYSQLQETKESQRDWNYYVELAVLLRAAGCDESAQEQWRIARELHLPLEAEFVRNQEKLECTLNGYK